MKKVLIIETVTDGGVSIQQFREYDLDELLQKIADLDSRVKKVEEKTKP
jgi:hypothetical protein